MKGYLPKVLILQRIQAKVKFLSIEPLLSGIKIDPTGIIACGINWLIIGQQTPPSKKTRPRIEWIQDIVNAADKAKIPVFLKNNLMDVFVYNQCSIMMPEWSRDKDIGGLRQEFPSC